MASGIHCDGPACATWAFHSMAQKSGFITSFDGIYPNLATSVLHFCSWDCLLRYAANKPSIEEVKL